MGGTHVGEQTSCAYAAFAAPVKTGGRRLSRETVLGRLKVAESG